MMNHQWLKFAGKIPPHRVTISPCDKTFCSSLRYVVGRSCFISSSSIISNGRVHLHHSFTKNNHLQLRTFAIKSNHQQRRRYRSKIPIYILTFITINAYGIYAHTDDTLFYYTYPLPFAIDIGQGPSMYPTMGTSCKDNNKEEEFNLYLRDTLSFRLPSSLISRKWKKGDIVTYYNPITKYMCTKRIIGVEGDTVCVFGEYVQEFLNHNCDNINNKSKGDLPGYSWTGVPHIEGLPFQCYCDMIASKKRKKHNSDEILPQSCTIIVPPNHVWLEGDNPLYSTDSRHLGPIKVSALRGRLIYRLWPSESERRKSLVADSQRPVPFT